MPGLVSVIIPALRLAQKVALSVIFVPLTAQLLGVIYFEHGRERNLLIGGVSFVNMPLGRTPGDNPQAQPVAVAESEGPS